MSTAPGQRGGASALEYVKNQFPRFGGEVVESFSLPHFYDIFDSENCKIMDEVLELGIRDVLSNFTEAIRSN